MPSFYDGNYAWQCARDGDPFIAELVKIDGFIDDHKYNAELLGIDAWAAAATVLWLEEELAKYQVATLYRWYSR
jgi:hypothetical protein